ncbi:hypothetical protein AB3X96_19665 [Paraburkholderia sp. BR13439]|uniref:hypothetical protein n=1 Tax=Paraburkholderia sp. BR13439 TaxID=3236996 RepID=UPI0034CE3433
MLGSIDYTKTEAVQLASEKIGKYEDGEQMWREVYHITFREKSGNKVKLIAVNEAAGEFECSIGGIDVFIVSGHLPSRDADRVFKFLQSCWYPFPRYAWRKADRTRHATGGRPTSPKTA